MNMTDRQLRKLAGITESVTESVQNGIVDVQNSINITAYAQEMEDGPDPMPNIDDANPVHVNKTATFMSISADGYCSSKDLASALRNLADWIETGVAMGKFVRTTD